MSTDWYTRRLSGQALAPAAPPQQFTPMPTGTPQAPGYAPPPPAIDPGAPAPGSQVDVNQRAQQMHQWMHSHGPTRGGRAHRLGGATTCPECGSDKYFPQGQSQNTRCYECGFNSRFGLAGQPPT